MFKSPTAHTTVGLFAGWGLSAKPAVGGSIKARPSGFDRERRSDEMSELCPPDRCEGYEIRDDAAPAPAASANPDMGGMY